MKFFLPTALVASLALGFLASADDFYVSCVGDNTIHKISGTTVSVIATGKQYFWGMAVDRSGNLYVPNIGDNNILKYPPGPGMTPDTATVFASGLSSPRDLAFDRSGNLYEVDATGNINKFVFSGGVLSNKPVLFADGSAAHANLTGEREPMNIAFDSRGDLYVSILIGGILRFTHTASGLSHMPDATPFSTISRAREMAFDKKGNLFVANHLSGDVGIYEFHNSASGLSGDPEIFDQGDSLNGPVGIAFDSDGNLFVTNWGYGSGSDILEYYNLKGVLVRKPSVCGSNFNAPNYILPIKAGQ
jgi:hypothetical protein